MYAHPAFCARMSANTPDGITVVPGTRFANTSFFTSATSRFVFYARPRTQLFSATLHTSRITPRFCSDSSLVAALWGDAPGRAR